MQDVLAVFQGQMFKVVCRRRFENVFLFFLHACYCYLQWLQVFMPLGLIFCMQCNDIVQNGPFSATMCCAFILFDNAFAVPVVI